MTAAPTLLIFMTTSGHYGCRTIYRTTLDWLDRQLPLVQWGARVASIKAKPGEEWIAEVMVVDLKRRGFEVEVAVAPWQRGQTHFLECLRDQCRMSRHPAVVNNPFVYITDDDYAPVTHTEDFPKVLHNMCQLMEAQPDTFTFRFLREQDADALAPDRTVTIEVEKNLAWSKHTNWQPQLLRSRDLFHMCRVIEQSWAAVEKMHGEAVWREAIAVLNPAPKKHACWLKTYAECVNIGVPEYEVVAKRLNLTVYPNPVQS